MERFMTTIPYGIGDLIWLGLLILTGAVALYLFWPRRWANYDGR